MKNFTVEETNLMCCFNTSSRKRLIDDMKSVTLNDMDGEIAELIPEGLSIVAPFDRDEPVASCRNADRPYGPDNYLVTVDGFIVSSNVSVLESKAVDTGFRWSDHNPVYLDFVLE